ncbi:SLC25A11 [Cordylochernes scorpioides]|uniref:SLC25A11 n=1 Tax=Cordylochernes scorpioides TaxID=51811 RepID=A0ABY6KJE0_9ARAC|nr:SLC25A11 [Cordylochernes scorpioides]
MQLSGMGGAAKEHKTSLHLIRSVIQQEGFFGLYAGLSAGLLRQASYTTVRMGVYTSLFEACSKEGKQPNFATKAGLGMVAGAVGAFFGNPAEISLIRMTADGRLPPAERRGYKNVFNALFRITKEEGVLTLWRGCIPTIGRAMVVNAAQLASYSQAKQILLNSGYFQDNIMLHFSSSMISGLITTIASMPVDIAKTRIQNMKIVDGKPEYRGAITLWSSDSSQCIYPCVLQHVLSSIVKSDGVLGLWVGKGFLPYYVRIAPHTVLTFIFMEHLYHAYVSYIH